MRTVSLQNFFTIFGSWTRTEVEGKECEEKMREKKPFHCLNRWK